MRTGPEAAPAEEPLRLSAVFGEEPASAEGPVTPPGADEGPDPSFDEFFASDASAELPSPPPPSSEAAAPSQGGEDLERFNAWLRGLKR